MQEEEQVYLGEGKEIMKKIFARAIPVIIVAATQNIYGIVDLKLIMTGLYKIGFDADMCKHFGSMIVTWVPKISMIINVLEVYVKKKKRT